MPGTLADTGKVLNPTESDERLLREVLVPRRSVFTVRADQSTANARVALANSGHSRTPLVRNGHLNDVIGVVNLRDLLDYHKTLTDVCRPPMVFPDTVRVSDALRRFKDEREQFALVANEHGAIVTLEDLLEEIVGEIYDETDRDLMAVQTEPDGALLLSGTFPIHDLPDLGVEVRDAPLGDYATIAGLVLAALGRIPDQPGDRLTLTDWTIEVTGIDGNAITAVRLRQRSPSTDPPNDGANTAHHATAGDEGVRLIPARRLNRAEAPSGPARTGLGGSPRAPFRLSLRLRLSCPTRTPLGQLAMSLRSCGPQLVELPADVTLAEAVDVGEKYASPPVERVLQWVPELVLDCVGDDDRAEGKVDCALRIVPS